MPEVDVTQIVSKERALKLPASDTPAGNLLQLVEHLVSFGDNSHDVDQLVEVIVSEISQMILDWQVSDLHEHFGVNSGVRRVLSACQLVGCPIQEGEDNKRLEGNPGSDSGIGVLDVVIRDLDRLLVGSTHLPQGCGIDWIGSLSLEGPKELPEFGLDVFYSLILLNPLLESPPAFFGIHVSPLVDLIILVVVLLEVHLPPLSQLVLKVLLNEVIDIRALSLVIPSIIPVVSDVHGLICSPPGPMILINLLIIHSVVVILVEFSNGLIVFGGVVGKVLSLALVRDLGRLFLVDSDLFGLLCGLGLFVLVLSSPSTHLALYIIGRRLAHLKREAIRNYCRCQEYLKNVEKRHFG